MVFGLLLIAVGIIALLVKTGVLSGSVWSYTWPTVLIILGLSFIFRRVFWRYPRRWFNWHDDRDHTRRE
jgi:uncharacterized membrane protein